MGCVIAVVTVQIMKMGRLRRIASGDLRFCGCFNGTDAKESESCSLLSDVAFLDQILSLMQTKQIAVRRRWHLRCRSPPYDHRSSLVNSQRF